MGAPAEYLAKYGTSFDLLPRHKTDLFTQQVRAFNRYLEDFADYERSKGLVVGHSKRAKASTTTLHKLYKDRIIEIGSHFGVDDFISMYEDCLRARQALVRANMKLIAIEAKKCIDKAPLCFTSTLEDLMPAAIEGFLVGIDKYGKGKGAKLSTYGCQWLRQRVLRAIWRLLPIKTARSEFEQYISYCKACKELDLNDGQEIELERVSAHLSWTLEKVEKIKELHATLNSRHSAIATPLADRSSRDSKDFEREMLAEESKRVLTYNERMAVFLTFIQEMPTKLAAGFIGVSVLDFEELLKGSLEKLKGCQELSAIA